MASSIVTKLGMCLETKQRCVLYRSSVGYICTCGRAQVRMCPFFRISETTGRIALKFGVSLENRWLAVLQKFRVEDNCTCVRAQAHSLSPSRKRLDGSR